MPATVVKETGTGTDLTANSYATVAEVQTYADNTLNFDDWDAASANDKAKAVIKATRILDKWLWGKWLGIPSHITQPLSWPRSGCITRQFGLIPLDSIPQMLINAVAELANLCLGGNLEEDPETGLTSLGLGPIQLAFNPRDRVQVVARTVRQELVSVLGYMGGAVGKVAR